MKVGDLVKFNKRAMEMKGNFPNEIMLILEMSEGALDRSPGAPCGNDTLLALNSSTGLIRRQYQWSVELVKETIK